MLLRSANQFFTGGTPQGLLLESFHEFGFERGFVIWHGLDQVHAFEEVGDDFAAAGEGGVIGAFLEGFEVRVEIKEHAGEVVLAVEDSGAGIPPQLRPRLFEPFFTTKELGSGLGLPQVHSVVQQHAGSISLEEGRTGGARFVIRLPLGLGWTD